MENKNHKVKRCPKCGASELEFDVSKQKLVCNYCHSEFDQEKVENSDLDNLEGYKISDGSKAITNDSDLVVLKCDNCGAEVVINTRDNEFRCHWCHSILSIKSQVGNGAVPDLVLPFKITKEVAKTKMDEFLKRRYFFADKEFKKNYNIDNITGVYFPYLLVDYNCHANYIGQAGHITNTYTRVVGKDRDGNDETETFYDIDLYDIEREFDVTIDDLEIESSSDKANRFSEEKTNNIINSIMPFDTENCVKYESNYLVGFNSEKRDLNVIDVENKIDTTIRDVVRYNLNNDLKFYDGGVRWDNEFQKMKGKQVSSAFLPVWLYSYKSKNNVVHYVAINARTGETMGSVPMNEAKIVLMCILIFLLSLIVPLIILIISLIVDKALLVAIIPALCFFLPIGIAGIVVLILVVLGEYRNKRVRHSYESETKYNITNMKRKDNKVDTLIGEEFSIIKGANNRKLFGKKL